MFPLINEYINFREWICFLEVEQILFLDKGGQPPSQGFSLMCGKGQPLQPIGEKPWDRAWKADSVEGTTVFSTPSSSLEILERFYKKTLKKKF